MNPATIQTAQITPLPWHAAGLAIYASKEHKDHGNCTLMREYHRPIAMPAVGEDHFEEYHDRTTGHDHNERLPSYAEARANADFIVRACNSHHELVGMLQDAALQMGRLTGQNLEIYARTFAAIAQSTLAKLESR